MELGNHQTPEGLLRILQERSDEFESIEFGTTELNVNGGDGVLMSGGVAIVNRVDGGRFAISREDLESLLNDGVLHRAKIPVKLLPPGAAPTDPSAPPPQSCADPYGHPDEDPEGAGGT